MERVNIATRSPWEPLRGFSRAVHVGNQIFISGTTAMGSDGEVVGIGDAYEQTRSIIHRVKKVLINRGFALSDVVRTRLFVTNIARWEDYARAHREAFETIRPASSIVQVVKLVDPRLLLEMEVDAIRGYEVTTNVPVEL